jgi:Autotransporter beta-domain
VAACSTNRKRPGRRAGALAWLEDRGYLEGLGLSSLRLAAQDVALSRRKQGFESPRERHRIDLASDFLVGAFGGYEYFNYSSDALTGRLKGDGWTAGSYLGWRLTSTVRFDLAVARSEINFNGTAGTFPGSRWLASGGLTGTYRWQAIVFQPSARIYALWEHEDAYTDSLGTLQAARNFSSGRASGGFKIGYPFKWSADTSVMPYAGLYGDYYFLSDDASTTGLASTPLLQGWSARFTSGVSLGFAGGGQLSFGGDLGGIGGNTTMWTWRATGSVPF